MEIEQMDPRIDQEAILRRMMEVALPQPPEDDKTPKFKDLAQFLGVGDQAVSNWKQHKRKMELKHLVTVALDAGGSLDYMVLGEGAPLRKEAAVETLGLYAQVNPDMRRLVDIARKSPQFLRTVFALWGKGPEAEDIVERLARLDEKRLGVVRILVEQLDKGG